MSQEQDRRHEFEQALGAFASSFELVFDNDWDVTKDRIADEHFVSPSGTFINPSVEDEHNNWANRGSLLADYRRLRELMDEYNSDVHS
ncbi:hypothetical protein RQM47_00380 [Rubrivirga sp. S365]|uniref:hypothetical protein n=1 Tax=Rubrivirga sp. S365 TaxID=3076080 RepID=UPI0028C98CF4|nr:hypothetical protein [Rubrivirga sp. S365]MDT7855091.1 hypothetical protein [Rubrivirga sp. S365]